MPAGDAVFREYLNGQEFSVLEQLSMPFWITSSGEFSILYIVEDVYKRQVKVVFSQFFKIFDSDWQWSVHFIPAFCLSLTVFH